jgi:hypothetical protein
MLGTQEASLGIKVHKILSQQKKLGMVAHTYHPSYKGKHK